MPFDDCTLETYREPELRLSRGAHAERKDGVCVLEAALEQAGFPHQRVTEAEQMPRQFCLVLCEYAMALNDVLPDELRTKLLGPFVHRLFGTGTNCDIDIALKRLEFIWDAVYRSILVKKAQKTFVFLDLVCEIARCQHPRKWELALGILDEAMAIGTQSRKEQHKPAFVRWIAPAAAAPRS